MYFQYTPTLEKRMDVTLIFANKVTHPTKAQYVILLVDIFVQSHNCNVVFHSNSNLSKALVDLQKKKRKLDDRCSRF